MAVAVIMPRQGQSVESCILTEWYKSEGDKVSQGDLLFAYETDKAAFEEEAQADGVLLGRFFEAGDEVPVLVNVAVIGAEGEPIGSFQPDGTSSQAETTKPEHQAEDGVTEASQSETGAAPVTDADRFPAGAGGQVKISPRARKLAKENAVAEDWE